MKLRTPQQLEFRTRGGKRKGAGRKKVSQHEPTHAKREKISTRVPMHLTLRCAKGVPSLRTKYFLFCLGRMIALAKMKGLNITQFAVESNHLHLIAEARDNRALSRGMMSLTASIRAALKHVCKGQIFVGRFHTHLLKTPTEMKHALKYVLFNHAKHCGVKPFIDFFSSAGVFAQIEEFIAQVAQTNMWLWPARAALAKPESWLQTQGWRRAKNW